MKNTVKAGLLALTTGSLPFASAAYAEDAPKPAPVAAATTVAATTISYVENADDAATEWNASNPDGIGIAVYMGTETDLTPEQLRVGLTNVANSGGVGNIEFFFEQNDTPANSFALYYQDVYDAPISMGDIIAKTQKATNYLKTDGALFQTASNDYDTLN
ncbi:hypothetical protein [Hyphomonas johnsonii]|uniref:Lipoprotein n=1 Tax=Hyphomonas johnsonii MHS-2 TaxID=1280950 RepID=A0A059FTI7_9PROT|nr:hypothetical protein [Hyphomonas johnsonii]KCZ93826.1 hypothetical protein HJO_00580 [Hyphomonas johnsonii MHS-2]